MGVGIREGSKAVIIFLTCRIPKSELDMLVVDFDVGYVVLENGRDVHLVMYVSWGGKRLFCPPKGDTKSIKRTETNLREGSFGEDAVERKIQVSTSDGHTMHSRYPILLPRREGQ